MKTNIKMSEPQFIINSKNGTVVCIINTRTTVCNLLKSIDIYRYRSRIIKFNRDLFEYNKFSAVAKLNEEDEWDEAYGKRIAESKCKRKIYRFYAKAYATCILSILDELETFDHIYDSVHFARLNETEHFKELMKVRDDIVAYDHNCDSKVRSDVQNTQTAKYF